MSLDPGDSILVASSFSHMLNLGNLAEEVQIAHRRRNKLRKGDFIDENNATTESDIEETLKRLVQQLHKSPEEVFAALKNQTVDLVLTAHPTQSVRRSLLQKHARLFDKLRVNSLFKQFSDNFNIFPVSCLSNFPVLVCCLGVTNCIGWLMSFVLLVHLLLNLQKELPYHYMSACLLLTILFLESFFRIRNCLTQLTAKDITPDDQQELDEALQREVT